MISFATDTLAPEDRFDHWREVRSKSLFGVTIEMPAERRRVFQGSFRASQVGSAVASEMQASAYLVSRTEADIARIAGDSLCISHQIQGAGHLLAGGDRIQAINSGDMGVSYSDLPYSGRPSGQSDFHYRMLKVPVDYDLMLGRPVHDLVAMRYDDDPSFARPFRALFKVLHTAGGGLTDPQQEVMHITRLALASRGRLARNMPEVRAALRSGLRHAAEDMMAHRKHQHSLTPATVAAELGISVRQLHIVFESAERSFSRTLVMMRMEEARRLLAEAPGLSITQIAYACGFDSLATFYRLFTGLYGMAPGDVRAATPANSLPVTGAFARVEKTAVSA